MAEAVALEPVTPAKGAGSESASPSGGAGNAAATPDAALGGGGGGDEQKSPKSANAGSTLRETLPEITQEVALQVEGTIQFLPTCYFFEAINFFLVCDCFGWYPQRTAQHPWALCLYGLGQVLSFPVRLVMMLLFGIFGLATDILNWLFFIVTLGYCCYYGQEKPRMGCFYRIESKNAILSADRPMNTFKACFRAVCCVVAKKGGTENVCCHLNCLEQGLDDSIPRWFGDNTSDFDGGHKV